MTDEELSERVDRLENVVAALRDRLDELEADGPQPTPGGIDHYDATVLQAIEHLGREPTAREIVHYYQEAGLHRKFADYHLRGEWYELPDSELTDHLEMLEEDSDSPVINVFEYRGGSSE